MKTGWKELDGRNWMEGTGWKNGRMLNQ